MVGVSSNSEFSFSCSGVVALVTGASRGLGREIATSLFSSGADLVLAARSKADLLSLRSELTAAPILGSRVHCCAIDLCGTTAVEELEEFLRNEDVRPNVLINNAATQGPIGLFLENSWEDWMHSFQLNMFAPIRLCKMVLPWMLEAGWGKIVTISGGGATSPRPRFTAYAAAKASIVHFTETLAAEIQALGVDVNAVAPGIMKSSMTDAIVAAGPKKAGSKEYERAVALGEDQAKTVSLAAQLCVFLSSHASDGITGKIISAAWDPWWTLDAHREELEKSDVYSLRRIVPSDRGFAWDLQ